MDQNTGGMGDHPSTSSSDNTSPYLRHSSRQRFSLLSVATLPQYTPFVDHNTQSTSAEGADLEERVSVSLVPLTSPTDAPQYTNVNPRFSTILNHTSRNTSELPSERTISLTRSPDYEYSYSNQANKPWATLKLYTHDLTLERNNRGYNQPRMPYVGSSEPLSGLIQLDINNPINIHQINLQLKGRIITSALKEGSYTFIDHTFPAWNKSMGDPQKSRKAPATPTKDNFDGKFHGLYSFPFILPFPTYVDLVKKAAVFPEQSPAYVAEEPTPGSPSFNADSTSPPSPRDKKGKKKRPSWSFFSSGKSSQESNSSNEQPKHHRSALSDDSSASASNYQGNISEGTNVACPMPQTFMDKSLHFDLTYELCAIFVHGRFRQDTKIRAPIIYLPSSEPFPMSIRRQQAYEAGALLPGPQSDINGWFALPKASVRGFFNEILGAFGKRELDFDCVLWLANPLSYTRGTVIPCYMSLSCVDAKALDALYGPKAPDVRLVRKLRYLRPGGDSASANQEMVAGGVGADVGWNFSTMAVPPNSTRLGNDLHEALHEVTHAIWWTPSKEVAQGANERWLEGELHLDPALQPSSACSIFSVEYIVEVHPPKSTHFESHASPSTSGKSRAHEKSAISSQVVEITTMHREGERIPVAFSEAPKTKLRAMNVDAIQEDAE